LTHPGLYIDENYEEKQDKSVQEEDDEMNLNEIYETSLKKVTSKINGEDNNINTFNENEESSNPAESAASEKSESESESEEEELPDEETSESEEEEEKLTEEVKHTRSGRIAKPPSKLHLN
jgi:hypothetical protein